MSDVPPLSLSLAGRRIIVMAAIGRDYAIGQDGRIPWHLPEDFKSVKARTQGKTLIMGAGTATSLQRALPHRRHLVVSRQKPLPVYPGMESFSSLEAACAELLPDEDLIVFGGSSLYAALLPYATDMWLTWVEGNFPAADTFFPAFPQEEWEAFPQRVHPVDDRNAYACTFVDYRRQEAAYGRATAA